MSGILLIGAVSLWIWAAVAIGQMLTSRLKDSWIKSLVTFLVTSVLIPLPVADEIIGGFQFRELCQQGYPAVYDSDKATGKTVTLKQVSISNLKTYMDIPRKDVEHTVIPIREDSWEYIEVESGELLLSWKEYHAKGGWLSRFIGFPQGSPPYTFNAVCSPEGNYSLLKRLNMKTIDGEKNHE